MKLKKIEKLFESKSNFDRKNKTNKSPKVVPNEFLEAIENGVTLEQLNEMISKGFKVFKYATQITIHGLFDDLGTHRLFGYKNLLQNKNKSIGVKYNAIDEEKRQRIAKKLKSLGISYHRSSTEIYFSKYSYVDEPEKLESTIKEYTELANRVDNSLFFGNVSVLRGVVYGRIVIMFRLFLNAIPEENVEMFIEKIGVTDKVWGEHQAKLENEKKESELFWKNFKKEQADKKERENKRLSELKGKLEVEFATDLAKMKSFKYFEKTNENGVYLQFVVGVKSEISKEYFLATHIKGKKKKYKKIVEFKTLSEALKFDYESLSGYRTEGKYSAPIYTKGFKIK